MRRAVGRGGRKTSETRRVLESEGRATQRTTGFIVLTEVLHKVQAPDIQTSDLGVSQLQHMFFAERAIHVWREGLAASEMLWYVDYRGGQDIVRAHPDCTDAVTNVPYLSVDGVVY